MERLAHSDIRITFANSRGDSKYVGPLLKLIFEGPELLDGGRNLIATHIAHQWCLPDGTRFSRLELYIPCAVWFEELDGNLSREVGPFQTGISAVDGVLYGDHRLIAFCDEQLKD